MAQVVETRGLSKTYGMEQALSHVDLNVSAGKVYGLLGPNGAGKTTLLKILLGLQHADEGQVLVFGQAWSRDLLAGVGALIEAPGLWANLTGWEHMDIHRRLRNAGQQQAEDALKKMGLWDVRDRRVSAYSLGMKGRLGIAIATLTQPKLLILDEPTNGLDPVGIREMREWVRALPAQGTTVILSSHQLYDVSRMCDHVGVLVSGQLLYQGELAGLSFEGSLEDGFFRLMDEAGAAGMASRAVAPRRRKRFGFRQPRLAR